MARLFDWLGDSAHWILRLTVAGFFGYGGWVKLNDLASFAFIEQLPAVAAAMIGGAELAGAVLILAAVLFAGQLRSTLTRLGAVVLAVVLALSLPLAEWGHTDYRPYGARSGMLELQIDILLGALLAYLFFRGREA